VLHHHPHRSLADLRGVSAWSSHNPILSNNGVSGKPGAVQTTALLEGKGSCAALTATVLAFTDGPNAPFEALVLRDHVLLASASDEGVYYELLAGGKHVSEGHLRRHEPHPPSGPVRVGGEDYLPFYIDNLAARLAEASKTGRADRAFQEALALGPKVARIHHNYGVLLLQRDRFDTAERYLTQAIRPGWKNADAFVNRSTARWKLGQENAARKDLRRALAPRHSQASINLRRVESK